MIRFTKNLQKQQKLLKIKTEKNYMIVKADFDSDVADPNTDKTVDDFKT